MTALILGKPDSGKSEAAETLATGLSEGGPLLYIATMIPYGEEGEERVKRHRKKREGKGFFTVEWTEKLIRHISEYGDLSGTTCLLECLSNLAGNEMHSSEDQGLSMEELTERILEEVLFLCSCAGHTVIVSNRFSEEEGMDEETLEYVRLTARLNERLRGCVDQVVEVTKGEGSK